MDNATSVRSLPEEIRFIREKKYRVVNDLSRGACGHTIVVHDSEIEASFVCKKFSPSFDKAAWPTEYQNLLNRFRKEARILFRLNHPNIVRVYNFFDYPEFDTAYILMEFVNGTDILSFVEKNPEKASDVFTQVIEGFTHLEESEVLHRDIRPHNILVTADGIVKIIDFGFGKLASESETGGPKSISLNWWCELPDEFSEERYDSATEVYFVGKLFEKAIRDNDLREFQFGDQVRAMSRQSSADRVSAFRQVKSDLSAQLLRQVEFSDEEIEIYRDFAGCLSALFSSIGSDATYGKDPDTVIAQLQKLYENTRLEEFLPNPLRLARIFVAGPFRYWKAREIRVATVNDFLILMRRASSEHRSIIMNNLIARLDAIERTRDMPPDDDIPF